MPSAWGEYGPTSALSPAQIRARLEKQTTAVVLANGSPTVIDSIVADTYPAGTWEVQLVKGTARRHAVVRFVQLGASASTDATGVDYREEAIAEAGSVDVTLSVDVSGAGVNQVVRLLGTASSGGWTANSIRSHLKPTT